MRLHNLKIQTTKLELIEQETHQIFESLSLYFNLTRTDLKKKVLLKIEAGDINLI